MSNEKPKPTIADLAMLVRRLIHQLNQVSPGNPVVKKAGDYLRRHDLQGSVLREIQSKIKTEDCQ